MDHGELDFDVDDYYFSASPPSSATKSSTQVHQPGANRDELGPLMPRSRACVECQRRQMRCSGESPRCRHCSQRDLQCVYEQLGPAIAQIQVMTPLVVPKRNDYSDDRPRPAQSERGSIASDSPTLGSRQSALPKIKDMQDVSLTDEPLPAHTGVPQPKRRPSSPLSKSSIVFTHPNWEIDPQSEKPSLESLNGEDSAIVDPVFRDVTTEASKLPRPNHAHFKMGTSGVLENRPSTARPGDSKFTMLGAIKPILTTRKSGESLSSSQSDSSIEDHLSPKHSAPGTRDESEPPKLEYLTRQGNNSSTNTAISKKSPGIEAGMTPAASKPELAAVVSVPTIVSRSENVPESPRAQKIHSNSAKLVDIKVPATKSNHGKPSHSDTVSRSEEFNQPREPTFEEVFPPVPPPKPSIIKTNPQSTSRPVSSHSKSLSNPPSESTLKQNQSSQLRRPSASLSSLQGPSALIAQTASPKIVSSTPISMNEAPRLVDITTKHSPASSSSSTTYTNSLAEKSSTGASSALSPRALPRRKPVPKANPSPQLTLTPTLIHSPISSTVPSPLASPVPSTQMAAPLFFSMADLGLIHHYTGRTAKTLGAAPNEEYRRIWQQEVPVLAQSYPFLMYAVLATAASHQAHIENKDHESRSSAGRDHFIRALTTYQSTVDLITSEKAGAVFCFCTLVMFLTFCVEIDGPSRSSNPIDSFVGNISILRGSANMLDHAREHIAKTPVGGLLDSPSTLGLMSQPQHLNAGASASIDLMEKLIGKLTAADHTAFTAYLDAIMKLRHFYVVVSSRPESWAKIVQWPMRLSPAFFELLRKRKAPALVIFAHWIVPLYHAPKRWFLGNWPARTLRAIVRYVPSSDWAQGLEWPLRELGMIET